MVALLFAAAAFAAEPVRAAAHDGTYAEGRVVWESTYASGDGRIELAWPLPEDARVDGATPVRDADGRIVALEVSGAGPTRTVRVSEDVALGAGVLPAPLARTDAVQRVAVDGVAWDPAADLEIHQWFSQSRQGGVTLGDARRCDRAVGVDTRHPPTYVVVDQRMDALHGLAGTLRATGRGDRSLVGFVAGAFFAVLGVGGILFRALSKQAQREASEAYIRHEFGKRTAKVAEDVDVSTSP